MSQDSLFVTLGGLQFVTERTGSLTSSGVRTIARMRGWSDGVPSGDEASPHWSGVGAFVVAQQVNARTVEMRGLLKTRTPQRLWEMRDQFASLKRNTLTVDEQDLGYSRLATVRIVDRDVELVPGAPLIAQYTLTLVADDPLRYGSATRSLSNGTNAIPNAGDEDASPTLTLTGPHSAVTIVHPGGTYTFAALSSGTRVLDFRNGDVWNASTRVFGVESGPRPVVRSGGSSWTVSGLGAGSATLARYEAWS